VGFYGTGWGAGAVVGARGLGEGAIDLPHARYHPAMPRHSPLLLCLALACGDDSTPQAEDGSEGGSSGSSSSTSPASTTTSEGSESSGVADTSTTAPADASSSDDSGSSDSGGTSLSCAPGQVRMVGELDGNAIDVDNGYGGVAATTLGIQLDITDRARMFLRGDVESVEDPVTGWGYLYMLAQDDQPEQWYCFDDSSSYVSPGDGEYAATLAGVQAIGACPGTPVSGTASICMGDESCGGTRHFVSEIEGASFSVPLGKIGSSGGKIGATDIVVDEDIGFTEGGTLHLHATGIDLESTEPEIAAVDGVYFIIPLAQPDGGTIYCAELGSMTYQNFGGFPEMISAEVSNISRLGTCTGAREGDGHLDVCINFGG
jgi:hypothetical protein